MVKSTINVEVAFAEPEQQVIVQVNVDAGASVQQAIAASGILNRFPSINLRDNSVGIFGKVCPLHQAVKEGDRVEIYRQLVFDPKEHRRLRAAGQK